MCVWLDTSLNLDSRCPQYKMILTYSRLRCIYYLPSVYTYRSYKKCIQCPYLLKRNIDMAANSSAWYLPPHFKGDNTSIPWSYPKLAFKEIWMTWRFSIRVIMVSSPFKIFDPFWANCSIYFNVRFLYPLKTSEDLKVFWCFQGLEKGCIGNTWVNYKSHDTE